MHLYEAEDYIGKEKDRAILEKNEKRSDDPEGVLLGFLVGGCASRLSKFLPYFRPKNVIFHTRFKTWRGRNYYVIIREIKHRVYGKREIQDEKFSK